MAKNRTLSPLARHGLLSLAVVAPLAFAGHLNILLNADLVGRQEVNTSGNNAIVGDPNGRGEQRPRGAHPRRKAGANGPVAANLANPENYYVNVHNTEFPGSAIRGQLDIAHDRFARDAARTS